MNQMKMQLCFNLEAQTNITVLDTQSILIYIFTEKKYVDYD